MNKIELPIKYYLTHFRELTENLRANYTPFFEKEHHDFLNIFNALSEDAQCLYLRMMNRKGELFLKSSLRYSEISDWDSAFSELLSHQFVRTAGQEDLAVILDFLPKKDLINLCQTYQLTFKKSSPREQLESLIMENNVPLNIEDYLFQEKVPVLRFLLFLYFGRIHENLSLYTLRDLGVRKVNQKKNFVARFQSKEEAQSLYFYHGLDVDHPEFRNFLSWPMPQCEESRELKEECLLLLSDLLKEEGDLSFAVNVLKQCKRYPGREKLCRLLYQMDLKEECKSELEKILETPFSDVEYLFAEDFYARKFEKRRRSRLTDTLMNARKISIDESYFRHPEFGVQEYFKEQGIESFHQENYLWNVLFGLLFWEELFESDKTGIFNEFERTPQEIYHRKFLEIHNESIQKKIDLLHDKVLTLELLLQKIDSKNGQQNGVFGWHDSIPSILTLFLKHAEPEGLKTMLMYLCEDFGKRSTGFPDLMAIENDRIKFYEIKAPGDSLKQQQLLQMLALQKAGFEVEVLQVEYAFNPNQTYVVVDLETTGSLSPYHRITEIGAVKVRNGQVIDKFQTLINPERSISREIQALTGITNEMVRTAPKFKEVAESFNEFSKDAIFVAHNVAFDYGFLQAEFERLEQRFTRPYICTKVSMRKHYPGLESYSLKNLTNHFQIPLMTHHRALCDAEAAAGLLFLINEKRSQSV